MPQSHLWPQSSLPSNGLQVASTNITPPPHPGGGGAAQLGVILLGALVQNNTASRRSPSVDVLVFPHPFQSLSLALNNAAHYTGARIGHISTRPSPESVEESSAPPFSITTALVGVEADILPQLCFSSTPALPLSPVKELISVDHPTWRCLRRQSVSRPSSTLRRMMYEGRLRSSLGRWVSKRRCYGASAERSSRRQRRVFSRTERR